CSKFRRYNADPRPTIALTSTHTRAPGTRGRHSNGRSRSSRGDTQKNTKFNVPVKGSISNRNHHGRLLAQYRNVRPRPVTVSMRSSHAPPRTNLCIPRNGSTRNARAYAVWTAVATPKPVMKSDATLRLSATLRPDCAFVNVARTVSAVSPV